MTTLDLIPGTLVVAVGPGAAGKSTFAAATAVDVVVCLDSLRGEIGGEAGDQSVTRPPSPGRTLCWSST